MATGFVQQKKKKKKILSETYLNIVNLSYFFLFWIYLLIHMKLLHGCLVSFLYWVQANSASGIAVSDECKLTFLELKARRNHRYIVFKIDDSVQQVMVDKIGSHGETYEDFTNSLPDNDCRYAVFDYDFTTDENCHKSKIFFIAW